MPADPARRFAAGRHARHSPCCDVQLVDGRGPIRSFSWVTDRSDNDDTVSNERRAMKVGRWEVPLRIAEDLELAVEMMNDDVVVDAEIRIVTVLMLTSDLNETSIGQRRQGLPKTLGAPNRPFRIETFQMEVLGGEVAASAQTHHGVPERNVHQVRVARTEASGSI